VAHNTQGTESTLRAFLLAEREEFRHRMCTTLAENADWSREAWRQLSHSVDVLAAGEPYRFSGYQLPDDHPARVLGVNVDFILDEHDVLRVADAFWPHDHA
jgi:hypothetical protein